MNKRKTFFKSGITLVVSLLFFLNTSLAQNTKPVSGSWIGLLELNDSLTHPLTFNFELKNTTGNWKMTIVNGIEQIVVDEVVLKSDSLFIKMPVFDSEFKCALVASDRKGDDSNTMKGVWINHARKNKNIIPFTAYVCAPICKDEIEMSEEHFSASGNWECDFSPGTKDASKAKGVFSQPIPSKPILGTFLTETGDYRFLSGTSNSEKWFSLSCFDGSHAFLFTGKVKEDSIIDGHFYSGSHHHETWVAKRNDKFQLRNPDSLTYLKPGFTKVDFNFKNLEGKNVSLQDEKFKNKVVIIQIMGTWCPNCMDETKFLAPFYDKYNSKGLEVVALAFERTDDFNKAVSNIQRSKTRFNAKYEFLITMKTGKDQASEALPMLNEVMAFPTTIYIDKKGVVRKIYTGFNGPATGDAHTKFVEETTRFVEKLLAE